MTELTVIVQVTSEISHHFAMKTHPFSIPIYNMPSSTILLEDSLEGKCLSSKMAVQEKSPTA